MLLEHQKEDICLNLLEDLHLRFQKTWMNKSLDKKKFKKMNINSLLPKIELLNGVI